LWRRDDDDDDDRPEHVVNPKRRKVQPDDTVFFSRGAAGNYPLNSSLSENYILVGNIFSTMEAENPDFFPGG